MGGAPQKPAKISRCLIFRRGGVHNQRFCRILCGADFLGCLSAFLRLSAFYCGGSARGVYTKKEQKHRAVCFLKGGECRISVSAAFCAVRTFGGVCPLFCVCPLFFAAGWLWGCTPQKGQNRRTDCVFGGVECGISVFAAILAVRTFWG